MPEDEREGWGFLGAAPVSPLLRRWSGSARLRETPLGAGADCGYIDQVHPPGGEVQMQKLSICLLLHVLYDLNAFL